MSLPAFATVADTDVASIGDQGYATLAAAIADAQDGDTITIDTADTYTLPNIPRNITIKGGEGVEVIFSHTDKGNIASIPNGATFDNVSFNFGNVNYHGFWEAGKIVMKNCTINGRLTSYGDMEFTGCEFNAQDSDYSMWVYGGRTFSYTDCTFNNSGKSKFLNLYQESSAEHYVTVSNCTFNSTGTASKAALNVKATSPTTPLTGLTYHVTISNCTATGNFPTSDTSNASNFINSLVQIDDVKEGVGFNITITIDGTQVYPEAAAEPDYVAQIGEGENAQKFVTLEAAFDAAKDGDTIKLLSDSEGNGIIAPEGKFKTDGLTVDFAGFTYTIVGPSLAGSTGTKTQAFQLLKGNNVTFKGGKIVADNNGIWLMIQNYSNLTLDGMTLDATVGNNSLTYVVSNNNGNIVIKDSTLIARTGYNAFDVCVTNYYPDGARVTVEGDSVISGKIEYGIWGTPPAENKTALTITGGTFAGGFAVDTALAKAAIDKFSITGGTFNYDPSAYVDEGYVANNNGDNTWTVIPANSVAMIAGKGGYTTLADAVAAANETDGMQTIEILSDITLTGLQSITTDVTIALGTHSISRTSDYANSNTPVFYVQGAANLNITGTTGNISVTNSGPAPAIMNAGTGKVTVSGGVIKANSTGSYSIGIFNTSTGSVEVAGGAVNSGNYGIYNGTGSVTVTSGTINSTNGYGIYNSTGTVAISGGTITGSQYGIWSKGNVTMTNGTVTGGSWGFAMIGTATLNLEGGAVNSSGYAISTNGNAGEDCTINISGGTIAGAELGVYQPSGKLNISGGTITGATGVYFKSTDITISGGTIIGTAEKSDYSYNGNGANATGDALVIDSCNYPNGIGTISISGGTYTSTYGNAVGSYNSKGGKLQTGFITGGTFSSDPMLFAGGNLVKVDYASVKQTDDLATYKVGKVKTTGVTAGERNTANDTVSYNMTTTVTDVVSSVELSSVTNTAVTVAGTKVNQESGITVTDSSTKTNAVGAAALDNVAGTSMNSVVSNAIRSAGENADSVKRIELVVVKGDTDTTTDTSTNKVTKVTYEVHPEAIAYKVENETSTKVGSYKISNDQLAETASFVIKLAVPNDIYAAAYEANHSSPKVKVTHISDDEDYADTEETLVIQGTSDNYYVEVTTSHFSEFSLEPDIQTTATTGNSVYACNLQLQGIIKVQYALNLTETIKSDANSYVVITMPNVGRSETIKVSDAANNAGYKVFGFSVAAQYMDEDTYVTLYNGAGAKVAFDNSNVADGGYAGSYLYGVYSYLNSNTVKNGSAYLQTLASSMKTYNQYAKYYFHPKEMTKPTHALPSITSESLNAYAKTTSGSIDGLTMYAANLQLKASTTVQIAYSGDVSGVTFNYTLADGEDVHKSGALTAVKNGNYWVVAVPDIAAQYLDDILTVTAEKSGKTYSVTYSPFTYVSNKLTSSTAGLAETVRALYGYNQAANEYFANK